MATHGEQVIISEAWWVLDRLICLFLHRVLAGTAHLCRLTVHLLHHCHHLQAELEENDGGGTLLANLTIRIMRGLSCSQILTEFVLLKKKKQQLRQICQISTAMC